MVAIHFLANPARFQRFSARALPWCAGLTAIRMAVEGRFELSIALIVVAALLDGVDGRLARAWKESGGEGDWSEGTRVTTTAFTHDTNGVRQPQGSGGH